MMMKTVMEDHVKRRRRKNVLVVLLLTKQKWTMKLMKTTNGKMVYRILELLAMKLTNLDRQLEKLKLRDVEIYGSKFFLKKNWHNLKILKFSFYSTHKEDEIEQYLRRKYADESVARRHFGDGGEEMSDEITQQTLLPGIK